MNLSFFKYFTVVSDILTLVGKYENATSPIDLQEFIANCGTTICDVALMASKGGQKTFWQNTRDILLTGKFTFPK